MGLQDALLFDVSSLTHVLKAVHKELGSDGHESNGDDDGTKANPRVDFGLRLGELELLLLEGVGGGRVEFESIVLAWGIGQEDAGAYVTKVILSVRRKPTVIPTPT